MLNSTASEWTETGSEGDYSVMDVHEGSWTVGPAKDGAFNGSISSLDAAYVLQAAVGLRQLNEAEALACDVTGNGRVSSLDAAEILRFVVGSTSQFPAAQTCGSDWLFIPKPAAAENQSVTMPHVNGGECQQGEISLNPLMAAVEDQDFLAILLGDCSGNWKPSAAAASVRTRAGTPTVTVRQLRRTRRGTARLPMIIRNGDPVHAIDMYLRYDPSALELTGATVRNGGRDVVVSHRADNTGRATLAVASAQPLAIGKGTMLIVEFDMVGSPAARTAPEVIYVTLDEKPTEVEQRPASLIRHTR
jgi:hypothetical protein